MKSRLTRQFFVTYKTLPAELRQRARQAYKEWRANPAARHFKSVGKDRVSARVDERYRVLGILKNDTVFWYWIGKHDEYDRNLS